MQGLKQQIAELTSENEQIKDLNRKLIDRIDYLQSVIDEEASGKDFYFSYPPKPDLALMQTSPRSNLKVDKPLMLKREEEHIMKLRSLYEDRIDRDKRLSDRRYNEMIVSYGK